MSATPGAVDEPQVTFEVATQEQVARWLEQELSALGITSQQLDEQAATGCFQSDRARRVWMASPNGQPSK
jgi:hypothetical protein